MSESYYGLQVRSGLLVSTVPTVNGIRYPTVPEGEVGGQSLAIHHDVLPGANTVELLIGGAGVPVDASPREIPGTPPGDLFAALILERDTVRFDGEDAIQTTDELDRADFRPADAEGGAPVRLPHRLSLSFTAPSSLTPPIWAGAEPTDTGAAEQPVIAALRELHALIAARDWDGYANRVALRYRDSARGFPLGPSAEERRSADIAMLAAEAERDGFLLEPFPMGRWTLTAGAGGRVVEATRADGGALVRAKVGDELIAFPAQFSLLDGRFQITR